MSHVAGRETTHDHTKVTEKHFHSIACVYPTLADGVVVTGAAGLWALGGFVEIVPVDIITEDFDIHFVNVEGATLGDTFEVVLYAVEVELARRRVSFIDIANSQSLPSIPFQTDIIPKNTQIQAKIANKAGGSEALTLSIAYHVY